MQFESIRSPAPVLSKGFYAACDDVKATQRLVIYGGSDRFPLTNGVEAVGLMQFLKTMATIS